MDTFESGKSHDRVTAALNIEAEGAIEEKMFKISTFKCEKGFSSGSGRSTHDL
jgi:hypothetical protein